METSSCNKIGLKYFMENNVIKKSNAFGNTHNGAKITDSLENLENLNDIYYLIIEKIEFYVGTYLEGSIKGMDVFYRNILSNKVEVCKNIVDSNHLTQDKRVFFLEEHDYIVSFIVTYGEGDVMRNVKITTKNKKVFQLIKFKSKDSKSILMENEIIPEQGNNIIVSLFYGAGRYIHKIGCYYLEEKFHKKIRTIYKFINFELFKKQFKNHTTKQIKDEINNNSLKDIKKISCDKEMENIINCYFHMLRVSKNVLCTIITFC